MSEIEELKRFAKYSSIFGEVNDKAIMHIANTRGEDRQLCKLQEEAAEVIQAVNKYRYHMSEDGTKEKVELIEELADCRIMIDQAIYLLNKGKPVGGVEHLYYEFINKKLSREIDRIESEKED